MHHSQESPPLMPRIYAPSPLSGVRMSLPANGYSAGSP